MNNTTQRQIHSGLSAALAAGFLALPSAHAATIVQTVSAGGGVDWNAALWDSPAAAPTAGNDYVTAAGLIASGGTSLGTGTNVTSRIRLVSTGLTFAGDSLTVSAGTEILGKNAGTYSANIILNGGIIRWAPDATSSATLGGTINVAADSVIGVVQVTAAASTAFTVSSKLTGSSNLRLAAGQGSLHTLSFTGDLSGYTGTFNAGGGGNLLTLNLAQEYNLPNLGLAFGDFTTADQLNLSHDISIGSFSFGASSLDAGTYTAAELNALYGSGSQFLGGSTLTVIPEPTAALLGGLGLLTLLRRRRAGSC